MTEQVSGTNFSAPPSNTKNARCEAGILFSGGASHVPADIAAWVRESWLAVVSRQIID